MSQLLDDEFSIDQIDQLAKERKARLKYAVVFVILGTLWGVLLPLIIDLVRSWGGSLSIILIFFGGAMFLLGGYVFKVFGKTKIALLYTGIVFFVTLGGIIVFVDEYGIFIIRFFNSAIFQFGVVSFVSALVVIGLVWVVPWHYKKTTIDAEDLLAIKKTTVFNDHLRVSIAFFVLMLTWGWGFEGIEDVFRENPISRYFDRYYSADLFYIVTTYLLVYLYKLLFGLSAKTALIQTTQELLVLVILLLVVYIFLLYSARLFKGDRLFYMTTVVASDIIVTTYWRNRKNPKSTT